MLIIIFYIAIHCNNLKPIKTQKILNWVFYICFSSFPTDTIIRCSFDLSNNMHTGTYIALVFLILVDYAAHPNFPQNKRTVTLVYIKNFNRCR